MSLSGPSGIHGDKPSRNQERSGSPVHSCVSDSSDRSMDKPVNFKEHVVVPQDDLSLAKLTALQRNQERSCSPVHSCDSDSSDRSMDKPVNFKEHVVVPQDDLGLAKLTAPQRNQERSGSPVHSCDSDSSDRSMDKPVNFKEHVVVPQDDLGLAKLTAPQSCPKASKLLEFSEHLKSSLRKKFECVYEGNIVEGKPTLFSDIYTELYIAQDTTSDIVNTHHEIRHIEMASKRPADADRLVHCNDIFKLEADKPVRTVLTRGVAGIGKTITVQKFILDWAEGKVNQDIHMILPLSFRELNLLMDTTHSLLSLLQHFIPLTEVLISELQEFLQTNPCKIVFIFDGFDECRLPLSFNTKTAVHDVTVRCPVDVLLTSLLMGTLLPSASVWVTSRPSAAHQIPSDYVDLLTEIHGFSNSQKELYFQKKVPESDLCEKIVRHVKSSRSLHIMCHIPVFCWIAAIVLRQILSCAAEGDIPKSLTEMYTHFLITITRTKREKYAEGPGCNDCDGTIIVKLAKLAFQQLDKGNLIFYEKDLAQCDISPEEALAYSGVCTQIFREEPGLNHGRLYSFVHLSIQEFLAALFLQVSFMQQDSKKDIATHPCARYLCNAQSLADIHRRAVDEALQSKSGHLDLFLRFLLGLSLDSAQVLLQCLLPQVVTLSSCSRRDETSEYIKQKIRQSPSTDKAINLFHCLSELKELSLMREIHTYLGSGCVTRVRLSPAQLSALAFVLLTSEKDEEVEVLDLKKYCRSDQALLYLLPCVKACREARLDKCNLTERSCTVLASVLCSPSSCLRILDLSANKLYDSGVEQLCAGLKEPRCMLRTLRLADCELRENAFGSVASALKANPCHLRRLDLGRSIPGDEGVQLLCSALEEPECTLEVLKLSRCAITEESCEYLASVLKSASSQLRELDLSENEPSQKGIEMICDALPHSKVQSLKLSKCDLPEGSCDALAGVLRSETSSLSTLNLNFNPLEDSGLNTICSSLQSPQCKLRVLSLSHCDITAEGISALAAALRSNPAHLRELDLSGNNLGDEGVQVLCTSLQEEDSKMVKLNLCQCDLTAWSCSYVEVVFSVDSSCLKELDMSRNRLGDSGAKTLAAALASPHCTLERLRLSDCEIGEEGGVALALALGSSSTRLKHLDLSKNRELGNDVLQALCPVLTEPNCKLQTLMLSECGITGKACAQLAEVWQSGKCPLKMLDLTGNKLGHEESCLLTNSGSTLHTPHIKLSEKKTRFKHLERLSVALGEGQLRELDLSHCELDDEGLQLITNAMGKPQCQLQFLRLYNNNIRSEGCAALASALGENPGPLRELDLSGNGPLDEGLLTLTSAIIDQNCHIHTLKLSECNLTESCCVALARVLTSPHLKELDLSCNDLRDSGLKSLCMELQLPTCMLEVLSLAECKITEVGCCFLAAALSSNPGHLRQLDLTRNAPGKQGRALLQALQKDPLCAVDILSL
ncbi:NACHT, LRR and PYD domains-containing protein 12-like [Engraulis encrasicolus]|uniref:NACHT, LRR and PYD domains-containing protein 12-like n=1 Tax=Engraulis encrasicolus TaxID=184585 RepID=UPI002FD0E7F0